MRKILLSLLLSSVLLCIGYFINNFPIFTGENLNQLYATQRICEWLELPSANEDESDATFVNVSYDKDLIDVYNSASSQKIGKAAITDRVKLYNFLKYLKEDGEYKYIILDIIFDVNDVSPADSMLYSLIESMDNIVVFRDDNRPAPPRQLRDKSALAFYYSTITATNFVRYQYLSKDDIPFIPLKVYEDLNHDTQIIRHGCKLFPIYTSGGRLCHNSSLITFDSNRFYKTITDDSTNFSIVNYKNLGAEIIEQPYADEEEIRNDIAYLSKDKYIIVGDYTDDLHDTYMGPKPGPYIIYRAFKNLEDGKHLVSFGRFLYWLIVFAFIFWWIIAGKIASEFIPSKLNKTKIILRMLNNKFLRFVISSIGYVFLLFICSVSEYIITRNVYSIVLPSFVFMITKLYSDYKRL